MFLIFCSTKLEFLRKKKVLPNNNALLLINDIPTKCVCGERFNVNHAMICMKGDFVVQIYNELRDLEAVCKDVETEPVLQDITGESWEEVPIRRKKQEWTSTQRFLGEATICLL